MKLALEEDVFEAIEVLPLEEMTRRHEACRAALAKYHPAAEGLAVFSRLGLYYLTGTFGNGVFWLPREGRPVLMIRKGIERARLESPLEDIHPFRSYGDIPGICSDAGSPFETTVAAEMNGLSWNLSGLLQNKLKGVRFVPGDMTLARAQAVKSPWELNKMRLCGERHARSLVELLPGKLKVGMTEREASHAVWEVFFELGHPGMLRMGAHGEEIFLGHVAAGDSGNYPSVFNGPLGLRGEHPAIPFMGYAGKVWKKGQPLSVDCGFAVEGYHTDKTQVYWAGSRESIPDSVARAHAFCMDVQAWVAENLKPGAIPSEIWTHCHDWAVKEGFEAGFMGLGGNKVPFLGHGIGLVVDAWPVFARGFDEPFEAGMVMAVEPKMGIEGVGMVGVENTFEVTENGCACLTGDSFGMICVE
jgi:Xaa-Pro dipeptidase